MEKIERLESELKKYQEKLRQMEVDWAASRGGSRYGDEYLETQLKVYRNMIMQVKQEILVLKKQNQNKKNY